jgi:hypothetical protein
LSAGTVSSHARVAAAGSVPGAMDGAGAESDGAGEVSCALTHVTDPRKRTRQTGRKAAEDFIDGESERNDSHRQSQLLY